MRKTISSAVPVELAERDSDTDEGYTAAEEAKLDQRVDALLNERLYDSEEYFSDLMLGGESMLIDAYLQRALKNLDEAINGDEISRTAVFTALSNTQRNLTRYARDAWTDELRQQAEHELARGEL